MPPLEFGTSATLNVAPVPDDVAEPVLAPVVKMSLVLSARPMLRASSKLVASWHLKNTEIVVVAESTVPLKVGGVGMAAAVPLLWFTATEPVLLMPLPVNCT